MGKQLGCLTTEAVQGAALSLERIDDVESRHSLAAGVLRVRHCIADDVLEEDLQDAAGLLIDEAADTLNTTTASQTTDGWLLQTSMCGYVQCMQWCVCEFTFTAAAANSP